MVRCIRFFLFFCGVAASFATTAIAKPKVFYVIDLDEVLVSSDVRKLGSAEQHMLELQGALLRIRANGKIYRVVHGARQLPQALRQIRVEGYEPVVGVFSSHSRADRTREIVQALFGPSGSPGALDFLLTHDDITYVDKADPKLHPFKAAPSDKKKDLRKIPGFSEGDMIFLVDDDPGLVMVGQAKAYVRVKQAEESDTELPRTLGLFLQAAATAEGSGISMQDVVFGFQWEEKDKVLRPREHALRDRYFTHLGRALLNPSEALVVETPIPLEPEVPAIPAPAIAEVPKGTDVLPQLTTPALLDRLQQPAVGLTVLSPGGLTMRFAENVHVGARYSIWRMVIEPSGTEVALKINRIGSAGRDDLARDARYNPRVAARGYTNVARIIEAGDDFVVKEWVQGETGTNYLRSTPLVLEGTPYVESLRQLVRQGITSGTYVRLLEPGHVSLDSNGTLRILRNGGILGDLTPAKVVAEYRRNFDQRWRPQMETGCADRLSAAVFNGLLQ